MALRLVMAYGTVTLALWAIAPLVFDPAPLDLSRPLSAIGLLTLAAIALAIAGRAPGPTASALLVIMTALALGGAIVDVTRPSQQGFGTAGPWAAYLGVEWLWVSAWTALPFACTAAMLLIAHTAPRAGTALAVIALAITYASIISWAGGAMELTRMPDGITPYPGTQIALMVLIIAASRAAGSARLLTGRAPDPRTARRWDLLLFAAAIVPVVVVVLVNLANQVAPDLAEATSLIGIALAASLIVGMTFYVRADRHAHEQEQRAIAEAERLALHDPLTGLANRTLAIEAIDLALARARRSNTTVTVLFCDLDGLKYVNDTHGHEAGDSLIRQTAVRLEQVVRDEDVVARVGGDEFLVVTERLQTLEEMEAFADRVLACVSQSLQVNGITLEPAISVGIAPAEVGEDSVEVIRNADSAMYRAKVNGRGRWELFDRNMRVAAAERLRIANELREATANGAISVDLQPIVRLRDHAVMGYEALARWNHPHRGVLEPRSWLEVANDTRQIVEIGRQVIHAVLTWLAAHDGGERFISVNVSARQLVQDDLAAYCASEAHALDVDPSRLVLEVSEQAMLAGGTSATRQLAALTSQHFGVLVDRFGTGMDALGPWHALAVSGLKLDGPVSRQANREPSTRIAAAAAGLVNGLHILGVATGIETREQADRLRAMGWEFGQGNLFGRPEPMAAVTTSTR